MREILFRGKRVDNGEWIEGHLIWCEDGRARIIPSHTDIFCYEMDESIIQTVAHRVSTETVGQYTGLTDKNGTKIFEGDICRKFKSGDCVSVAWHGTMAGYVWSKRKENNRYIFDFGDLFRVSDKYEVIGNIHDNPELLDGAGNG